MTITHNSCILSWKTNDENHSNDILIVGRKNKAGKIAVENAIKGEKVQEILDLIFSKQRGEQQ